MKNNFTILFIMMLTISSFNSCKKGAENCKLGKHYVSDGNSTPKPDNYIYYNSGDVQTITYGNGSKDTFAYVADTVYIVSRDYNDSLYATFTGILDGSRHVISAVENNYDLSGNVTSTNSYLFEYDATGHLTRKTISNSFGTTILDIDVVDGNAVGAIQYAGINVEKAYTFFRNKASNKTGIDDFSGSVTTLFGTPSLNLLDSTHVAAMSDTVRIQYAHSLDKNDYIQKTIQTSLNPTSVQTRYHTYQYFNCSE